MTTQPAAPPAPPAPLSPEAAAQLREANRALEAQIENQALRQAAEALQGEPPPGGRPGNVSVIKNPQGHIVVTGPDGRTVTYDPDVGMDEDAIQEMVQTALAPPPAPEFPRAGPPESVMIVGIVFSFLLLMTFVISVGSVLRRRAAAGAAAQAAPPDLTARLARIEQAVEAVAIEVERISESERYSARLLTERLPEPLGRPLPAGPNGQGAPAAAPTLDATR